MSFPRYPEYKDSGVEWLGEVPAHWETWKVAHAFGSIGSGTTPPSSEEHWYDSVGTPWVTTGELRENIIFETSKSVTDAALEKFSALRIHPAGSLVVAMYGATIGRLGILGVDAVTNQACCVLSYPRHLDIAFTYYWLQGFKQIIIDLFSTGGGQPNINQDTVASLRIPAPGLPEQTAIATFLDRETAKIDALVAEQEKLIALLQEKRQAVISHAVTKGLDPNVPMKDSGVEWLGEVPGHWEVRRVRNLSSFLTSGPRGWSERISEIGAKFIQSGDLTDDLSIAFDEAKRVAVDADAEAARTKLENGDVVVCITGAKTGNVAVCVTIPEDAYVNQHLCLIRPRPEILPEMLATYLKSEAGQRYFAVAQYGLKQGMSLENIKDATVPVPPLQEQRKILEIAQRVTKNIGALVLEARTAITLLQERRTALISAAVTGQIDVQGIVSKKENA